jgi:hypothetical protein
MKINFRKVLTPCLHGETFSFGGFLFFAPYGYRLTLVIYFWDAIFRGLTLGLHLQAVTS